MRALRPPVTADMAGRALNAAAASFWRRNGLSLVLAGIFLAALCGQILSGHAVWNEQLVADGKSPLDLWAYLHSGHFVSATFENWESEFLQMGMYVVLTVWLRQRGSAESRPLDPAQEKEDIEPGPTPWPARKGGLWHALYANSLSIAFFLLFALSFCLHLDGSWRHALEQRAAEGQPPITLLTHLCSADFWFESFQNWQSEFLAVLALVLLSIVLRQHDSPQSKPVRAPNSQTGT